MGAIPDWSAAAPELSSTASSTHQAVVSHLQCEPILTPLYSSFIFEDTPSSSASLRSCTGLFQLPSLQPGSIAESVSSRRALLTLLSLNCSLDLLTSLF
eukprot:1474185-Rhodomonas_salina.1